MDKSSPLPGETSDLNTDDYVRASVLTKNFIIALILSSLILLSRRLNLSPYTQILIVLALILFGGRSFLKGCRRDLKNRVPSFDTLLSLSAWAAFLISAYAVFFPETLLPAMRGLYWIFIVELIVFAGIGKTFETRLKNRRRLAARNLNRKIPTSARVIRSGKESFVFLSEIAPGESLLVRKGEEIPIDGICRSKGVVDESLLNDRKAPSPKSEGSPVWGGSIVHSDSLEITAGKDGSIFSRAISSVIKNADFKREISSPLDKVAAWIVVIFIAIGLAACALWGNQRPQSPHCFCAHLSSLDSDLGLPTSPRLSPPSCLDSGLTIRSSPLRLDLVC